ncbi:MAG: hypothetical protein H7A32_06235 [Deltaproteobacteria bacterium]|nr:hypothetical protein [Deltaproteobacteria bacterium]
MESISEEQVNQFVKTLQQGDCILGDCTFLFGLASCYPLKEGVEKNNQERIEYIEESVIGLCILTQTCDLVRTCQERRYIEFAPLQIEEKDYLPIKKFKRPSYVAIPVLESEKIIVNLEKTMTLEKPVLALWHNTKDFEIKRGLKTESQITAFSWALARKRSRFAFPDEFVKVVKPFLKRINKKYDKKTDEGRLLAEIKEIRVRAEPSWTSGNSTLMFYFFVETKDFEMDGADQIESWRELIDIKNSSYIDAHMFLVDYDDLSAREYKESVPLDLDALSLSS